MLPTKELAQQVCGPRAWGPPRSSCHWHGVSGEADDTCALQVSRVFNVYTDATPLRVALVTGQKSLAKEQETLVQKT